MTDTRSLPALATAGITLAAAAPAVAIGAAIGLGLLWLFSGDDQPQTVLETPGTKPPAPAAKPKGSSWFLFDDEPEAPATRPVETTAAQHKREWGTVLDQDPATSPAQPARAPSGERPGEIEVEIAAEKRAILGLKAGVARTRNELARAYARNAAQNVALPMPKAQPAPVRPQLATPAPTMLQVKPVVTVSAVAAPAASHTPAAPIVTVRPPAPAVATPARPVTVQAVAPLDASRKVASFAPTVKREDLAAIFASGAKRLTRKEAVAALKARGAKQTAAYNALRDGGRFADCLEVGEDGLLTFKA